MSTVSRWVSRTLRLDSHLCAVRRRARATLAMIAALGTVLVALPAAAQSSRDIVGGPITTQRLERFLKAYVSPTDAEAAAIDRLHESYLDRYRAEIEPEASTMMNSMSGRQPSKDEYEKFLRNLDRLQDKISEADNQFFASATELLAESRRGGMQRVRETRERQRLLSGIVQFAPMMLGGGAGFIDLPARAIREEYFGKVAAENREAFDAALRSQEQRTLSQARTYNADVRKALVGFFDIMMSMQESMQAAAGSVDPANPDSMPDSMKALEEQQRAMMEKLAALGADVRKSVKSNFEANRAGVAALAALLPEDAGLSLRLDVADAAANSVGFNMSGGSRPGMRTLGRRIERDPDITPEVKAEIARILTSWRREQAQASEKVAELALDAPSQMSMFGMSGESEALESARRQLREVGNNALKQIAAKLGEKAPTYVTSFTGYEEDGTESEFFRVANATKPDAETDAGAEVTAAAQRSMFVNGGLATTPDALTAADIVRVARTIGLDSTAQSVIEAIVDGWKTSHWDAQMSPIAVRIEESGQKLMSTNGEGGITYDESAVRTYDEARLQAARAVFELDEKLYTDLASALGLAGDDPLLMLLRFERTDLAASRASGMAGSSGLPLPLGRLLASASIDPGVARAVLEGAKAELNAIAVSLPQRVQDRMELSRRRQATERVFASRDQAAVERASREYGEFLLQEQRLDRAFGELLTKTFVDAFNAHAGDAAVAGLFRRTLLATAYPDVYKRSDSAQSQLDAAQRLPGLTDDQRARIIALEAEYAAVYEKLSGEMVMPPNLAMTGAADEATWAEYQKRAEAVEKARFNRKERTEKVLAELRRVLGVDLATSVPGLVVEDESATGDDDNMNPWIRDDD